jgi:hypothetical protein
MTGVVIRLGFMRSEYPNGRLGGENDAVDMIDGVTADGGEKKELSSSVSRKSLSTRSEKVIQTAADIPQDREFISQSIRPIHDGKLTISVSHGPR